MPEVKPAGSRVVWGVLPTRADSYSDHRSGMPCYSSRCPHSGPRPVTRPKGLARATLLAQCEAKISHSASTGKDVKCYPLRGSAREEHDERDAVGIATHAPGGPPELVTIFGLPQSGAQAWA
jgi:hypothetical protein